MGLSTTAKVGILTIVALIALGAIVIWKTDIFLVRSGYELVGSFDSVEGLTIGSEVRYRGFRIGKVMKIDPGPLQIMVYSLISRDIKFPADSVLRVAYDGLVGQKYLEVKPGTSEAVYQSPDIIYGTRTSGIVDFIDIGSQNLKETKLIFESIRQIVQNPRLQAALMNTVYTAEKVSEQLDKLTSELRQTNKGIMDIVNDPKFQQNVKGTMNETEKTLSSANRFFDSVGKINLRASGGVDIGTRANAVRGDVDIVQSERTYYRIGFGEGPARTPGVLDFLLTNKTTDDFGFRLGVINSQLGGGIILTPTNKATLLADIYDINNPRPNWPRVRLGYEYELRDYLDMLLQGDDLLNEGNRNIMLGIRVKPPGEKLY
ncbi:MAG: MlaD family protein [Candidatus Margulisbacteria bacterium]|nr:MlaD family protein [Candidatus Margulisiibacteriota bacterium]